MSEKLGPLPRVTERTWMDSVEEVRRVSEAVREEEMRRDVLEEHNRRIEEVRGLCFLRDNSGWYRYGEATRLLANSVPYLLATIDRLERR